jgi:hypothetical protein
MPPVVQGILYRQPAASLRGDALLPLRQLRTRYPDLYEEQVRKYDSRPGVIEQRVEPLDCTWGDVLHLSPVAIDRLERLGPDDPWLPWVDVPHVLYRGAIPVSWFGTA